MNSRIVATKNSGIIYQEFTAEATKESKIGIANFIDLVVDLIDATETIDSISPTEFNIESCEADVGAVSAEEPEYSIDYSIYFNTEDNLNLTYAFEDTITDPDDFEDSVIDNIKGIFEISVGDIPKILVRSIHFDITVSEKDDSDVTEE